MPVIIKKCEFYTKKLKQISIDPKNVISLRLFLGFCNYY